MNPDCDDAPRRALVLGAGAAYGAFQIGALRHIIGRKKTCFSVMTGASVGAVNAAVLAQAESPDEVASRYLNTLEDIWQSIDGSGQIMGRPWARKLSPIVGLLCQGPCNLDPLRDLLEEHVCPHKLKDSPIELAIEVACLDTGRIAVVEPEDPHFLEFLIASCSMPMYFAPVTIEGYMIPSAYCEELGLSPAARADIAGLPFPSLDSLRRRLRNRGVYGKCSERKVDRLAALLWTKAERRSDLHWCDAYIRRILPLTPALKKKPDEVTVIHALPTCMQSGDLGDDTDRLESFQPRVEQAMKILCHEIQRTNSATAHVLNELLRCWRALDQAVPDSHRFRNTEAWQDMEDYLGRYHLVSEITEISPHPEYIDGHPLDFTPELITELIEHGEECAEEAMPAEEPVLTMP